MADGVLSRKTLRRVALRRARGVAIAIPILLSGAAPTLAQLHRVTVDGETFRQRADGRRLADLAVGAQLVVQNSAGAWSEVLLEGWVPSDGIGPTTRDGFNSVVTRVGGIVIAAQPDGAVTGSLLQGFLLDGFDQREGWTRVRRTGWVRAAALEPVLAGTVSDQRPPRTDRPPPLVAEGRRLLTGDEVIEVQGAPQGGRIATVEPGTPITVVERGSGWTRVQVEGWVRSDQLATSDPDSVLADVSASALRANPDQYVGMRVRWTVQFVALERAEPERTDFYEGEPFLLARAPDAGDGFVYIAVPDELLDAAAELRPLEMIDVLAQVRTGRSSLMGVPVLDLLAVF